MANAGSWLRGWSRRVVGTRMPQLRRVPSLESVMAKNWLIRYLGGTLRQSMMPARKIKIAWMQVGVNGVRTGRIDAAMAEHRAPRTKMPSGFDMTLNSSHGCAAVYVLGYLCALGPPDEIDTVVSPATPATTPCLACSPPRSVIQRAVIPKQIVWAEDLRSYASPPNPLAKQGPALRARQPSTENRASIASTGRAAAHQLQWRSWSHCELGTVGGFCEKWEGRVMQLDVVSGLPETTTSTPPRTGLSSSLVFKDSPLHRISMRQSDPGLDPPARPQELEGLRHLGLFEARETAANPTRRHGIKLAEHQPSLLGERRCTSKISIAIPPTSPTSVNSKCPLRQSRLRSSSLPSSTRTSVAGSWSRTLSAPALVASVAAHCVRRRLRRPSISKLAAIDPRRPGPGLPTYLLLSRRGSPPPAVAAMTGTESAASNQGGFDLLRRATQAMMSNRILVPIAAQSWCPLSPSRLVVFLEPGLGQQRVPGNRGPALQEPPHWPFTGVAMDMAASAPAHSGPGCRVRVSFRLVAVAPDPRHRLPWISCPLLSLLEPVAKCGGKQGVGVKARQLEACSWKEDFGPRPPPQLPPTTTTTHTVVALS
ncbi:hypothetical protein BKA56DRAFT_607670 [Ilyonectria sp. MPI-CAGE-AT-0026]|nr:hypothetical protein BKA56DRAFT_607670 [Ilyonectria sp. MPI-CAGE-AT-0026]